MDRNEFIFHVIIRLVTNATTNVNIEITINIELTINFIVIANERTSRKSVSVRRS